MKSASASPRAFARVIASVGPSARLLSTRLLSAATLFATSASLAACGDDGALNSAPQPPNGIVVMDGFIQPGLTLLADTGSASNRVIFGSPTEFDAGGFTMLRDTVLSTSSRAAGDLLYITDLKTGTMRRLQLPAKSNPSRARLFQGSNGLALIGVALRDSNAIALVSVSGSNAPTITRIANAGLCPTDAFQYDNATWVVDANANCKVNYAVQGDVRLIRIPNTGTTRDTIVLPGMRGSGAGAIVVNDIAYISAGGTANFSSSPFSLISTGSLAKVDLRNKRLLQLRQMPAGTFGAGAKLGLDNFIYVSLSEDLISFRSRILKIRTDDLGIVAGVPATATTSFIGPFMKLTSASGADVTCSSGQADALGRLHCIANGAASATSLIVFNPAGTEVRRVPAGQGGVDLALR